MGSSVNNFKILQYSNLKNRYSMEVGNIYVLQLIPENSWGRFIKKFGNSQEAQEISHLLKNMFIN